MPYRDTVLRLGTALCLQPDDRAELLAASRRVRIVVGHGASSERRLPTPLTSFVGRSAEIEEVGRLLQTTRLVTLTGAGGIGKTRLALEVVLQLGAAHHEEVAFAEFAALADPALVPQVVASALNIQEQPGRPIVRTLVDALGSRRVLLVLDNCEHLLLALAELVELLLHSCAGLRILTTSRQRLHVAGEVDWRVPSLDVPAPSHSTSLEVLAGSAGVQLFCDRAKAALPSFALVERTASAVARVCQRLDGIPLALELTVRTSRPSPR